MIIIFLLNNLIMSLLLSSFMSSSLSYSLLSHHFIYISYVSIVATILINNNINVDLDEYYNDDVVDDNDGNDDDDDYNIVGYKSFDITIII